MSENHAPFFNRELSLLRFHRRVFVQALDPQMPLLERFRFLCIAASNLDEFFEVRVAGLKKQVALGNDSPGPDGLSPRGQLAAIADEVHRFVDEIHQALLEVLIPQLNEEGIHIRPTAQWTEAVRTHLRERFRQEVLPVLSPLRLDPAHPFPRVLNKCLHLLVALSGPDAFGPTRGLAVVPLPRTLPRLFRLPPEICTDPHEFVYLSSVLAAFAEELFPGMTIEGAWTFRVTRDSDLELDDDDDLMRAVSAELPSRRFGDEVRLEVDARCPESLQNLLLSEFELASSDLYLHHGPVNLQRLQQLVDEVDRPDLKHPPFTPGYPAELDGSESLFETLKQRDILLHHPYQSFAPVTDFVEQAADDPAVVAIRQTLYRTDSGSTLVAALERAARAGKEVTVVVELLARFDEASNIEVAERLQDAGAQVLYGVMNHKTHAKMSLVVRKEAAGIRRYMHLGTGNYNAKTARLYTDYGLLTADPELGHDVQRLFHTLTGFGRVPEMNKLVPAPFHLHRFLLERIDGEIAHQRAGRPAQIRAKMNALIEPGVIRKLYEASQAGVRVELVVRGPCCLRPGVEGWSENVRVKSLVGRFLEHHRCFAFENGGEPQVYLASADWMDRNLFRRVETCFPVERPDLKARLLADLDRFVNDPGGYELRSDGSYEKASPEVSGSAAQAGLLEELSTGTG